MMKEDLVVNCFQISIFALVRTTLAAGIDSEKPL